VVNGVEGLVTLTMNDGGRFHLFPDSDTDAADVTTFVSILTGMRHKMFLSTDPQYTRVLDKIHYIADMQMG